MPAPLITATGLTKHFDDTIAVDGIDFHVDPGESFGFLGPNGAGKTSVLRMISAVSPITAGKLSVLGLDPRTEGPELRARLGVVPQEDNLDQELTVTENLNMYGRYFGLPKAVIAERITELLDFAQLSEKADSKVEALSGGMKRRLTIWQIVFVAGFRSPFESSVAVPDALAYKPGRVVVVANRRAIRADSR